MLLPDKLIYGGNPSEAKAFQNIKFFGAGEMAHM